METLVNSAKAAAVAVGVLSDNKENGGGSSPSGSPHQRRRTPGPRSFKRGEDDEDHQAKVDQAAVGMLSELVVQVDHNGVPYSRNTKWNVLAQTMHLARWKPAMVEAALKGVKKLSKTSCSKDHIGVMRFYNQMLWSGKEKALKVICTPKHSMRLEKCTHKAQDSEMKNVTKTFQQLLADWIEMFDAFHSCEALTLSILPAKLTPLFDAAPKSLRPHGASFGRRISTQCSGGSPFCRTRTAVRWRWRGSRPATFARIWASTCSRRRAPWATHTTARRRRRSRGPRRRRTKKDGPRGRQGAASKSSPSQALAP